MDLSLVHPLWVIALSVAGSIPLGWWMARVLDPPPERVGKGLDAAPLALLGLLGIRQPAKMSWKEYAFALLAFNTASLCFRLQSSSAKPLQFLESRRQRSARCPRL